MATTVTTSDPNAVPVENIVFPKGDSDDILVTVRIPNATDPTILDLVDLGTTVDGLTAARPAILRWAVKRADAPNVDNALAPVFKASHFPDEITILPQTGATLGQARILVDKPDTETLDEDEPYCYDLEVSRQDALRTGAQGGTIELQAAPNGATVLGVSTDFTKAKEGDILQVLDGNNDSTPVIIQTIVDATTMTVSLDTWDTPAAGLSFEIRRGHHRTAVKGSFALETGQVKK